MMKLNGLTRIRAFWQSAARWLSGMVPVRRKWLKILEWQQYKLSIELQDAKDFLHEEQKNFDLRVQELAAQVVQLRAGQSRITDRAGWEVSAFIPEGVLAYARASKKDEELVRNTVEALVRRAIEGLNRVDAQGRVAALVFEPLDMRQPARAPRYVQALYDNEGKFKLSEKAWDQSTEEQRVRRAAGCGGFGV